MLSAELAADLAVPALAWRAAGRRAVIVQVQAHRGSVPRETGTRMLVAADAVLGTIGGGRLELMAIAKARELLAQPASSVPVQQRVPLGPALGQCCGGEVVLGYRPLLGDDPESDPRHWAATTPAFDLQLYGAGHVGRAIVRLLESVPCRVRWIDEREAEFPAEPSAGAHIERLCVEPVEAEVAQAGPGSFFLVLTHSHDLDLALALEICRRGDFAWFGLIGSKSKRARFEHRLLERGVPASTLQRMVCPIGLPGIDGKEPGTIAVAVVAQMLLAAGRG
ncbi:MAG: xanthine dehydrogenase accessory protein XdhC [Rubrivivax sp.]|jgi:xanthine dehydrogenase accessory factor|nr:xanthine dehydrogenase accessory protein XdhC [Rubrivivax sp.]